MFKNISLYIAFKYLLTKRDKDFSVNIFSIMGVFISSMALIIVFSIMNNLNLNAKNKIFDNHPHAISTINNNDSKNIQSINEYYETKIILTQQKEKQLFKLIALSEKELKKRFDYVPNKKFELIVPKNIKQIYQVNKIDLNPKIINFNQFRYTPIGNLPVSRKFEIKSFYKTKEINSNYVYTDIKSFKKITLNKIEPSYELKLINPENLEGLKEIKYTWKNEFGEYYQALEMEKNIVLTLVISIIFIALLNIYLSVEITINEKRKDISILKSIGYSNNIIYKIFLVKNIINNILGLILGNLFSILIIKYYSDFIYFFNIENFNMTLNINLYEIVIINFSILITNILTIIIPIKKSTQINPIEVLNE